MAIGINARACGIVNCLSCVVVVVITVVGFVIAFGQSSGLRLVIKTSCLTCVCTYMSPVYAHEKFYQYDLYF